MPSFGKKKRTVEERMAGLEARCEPSTRRAGATSSVAALFAAMSGQCCHPVLCQIMG